MDITTVVIFIKQVLATFLTLLMMMSPVSFSTGDKSYKAENADELVMSFAAVSDIHVETNNPKSYYAFSELLNGIKAGENHDAVAFLGDNVMNGQIPENLFFYTAVRAVMPGKLNFVAQGNHDVGNGEGDYDTLNFNYMLNNKLFLNNEIDKPYYYKVVNGCYMIFLASDINDPGYFEMDEEQLIWLKALLDEASAAGAPIFVFNHFPVWYFGTEHNSTLSDIINKYENVLYIHGHIHNELKQSSFYTSNGINCINLPRSTEVVDYEPGDGIVVEVYDDEILVRGRDFIKGEWVDGLEYRYSLAK